MNAFRLWLLFALLPFVLRAQTQPPAASASAGDQVVIKDMSGPVECRISAAEQWQPAAKGTVLKQQAAVRTGAGGKAIVQIGLAGAMTLGESTMVEVGELLQQSSGSVKAKLKALSGKVWFAIEKLKTKDSSFEVESPTGLAGVRGTIFLVSVAPDGAQSRFGVEDGVVEVRSTTVEGSVTLNAGQATTVVSNKAPTAPETFEERERGEWLKMKGDLLNAVPFLNLVPGAGEMLQQHGESMAAATKQIQGAKLARKGGEKAQDDLVAIQEALTKYFVDTAQVPTQDAGLSALLKDPGVAGWKGPYLAAESNLQDPFGKTYRYKLTKTPGGKDVIEIRCTGVDGAPKTDDDIVVLVPLAKLEKARAGK